MTADVVLIGALLAQVSVKALSLALLLQICASTFALLGTWLLRKPGPRAPWGFVAWLVSNPAAMVFMALQGHWLFVLQHLVFFLLALESVWYWLVLPLFNFNLERGDRDL
jgi:hypothetical protein